MKSIICHYKNKKNIESYSTKIEPYKIVTQSFLDKRPQKELILDPAAIATNPKTLTESALLEFNIEQIRELRRCSRCLLPETFPFIELASFTFSSSNTVLNIFRYENRCMKRVLPVTLNK